MFGNTNKVDLEVFLSLKILGQFMCIVFIHVRYHCNVQIGTFAVQVAHGHLSNAAADKCIFFQGWLPIDVYFLKG